MGIKPRWGGEVQRPLAPPLINQWRVVGGRFLMSFVVDARGATVSARRRRGLRISVPAEAACMPTRITCRVARRQRDGGRRQPQLSVGDGLATHVLEMGPVGEQFTRCQAPSTPATMSKQHCRSNRQLCCLLLRQCCRFGQQRRSNVRLCRKDEISTQNSFDIVAVFGNKVERCFDIVAKKWQQCRSNIRHCSIRQCCFDIVAGVDGAWHLVNCSPTTLVAV